MAEKPALVPTGSGCLSLFLRFIGLKIVFEPPKLTNEPLVEKVDLKSSSRHQAITGPDLRYVHPELVPSQPEYIQQNGGKTERVYNGQDRRGG
ncbi:MAG: hypothetical protein UR56_C0007G0057 [Candidatus Roizmanbacteria bacterium GW2011_GWC2_34_23]|uniref:Uncharacterized protein n=1 Tax=Candidatus Roizmanbacteria bacterium GW2011_GWC2_34_23 TaxID=1618484 RepID=A0A0G0AYE8_9BACT|nr:MAG: hypothetical protein UR56_C0007G0057 [Candidatus Roizmanbacteria bacterium GW2011_GWC2_34_23]